MVLVLLQQDLCQQTGTGDTLIDRQQGHGSNQHTAHALGGDRRVVLQPPLLADDFLDVQLAGFVLHDTCHLLANLLVEIPVEIVRCEDHLLQHGQVLHHDAVLLLLTAPFPGLNDFLHCLVMGIGYLLRILRQHAGKEVELAGIDDGELLRLAPEELAVQPCNLSRQFLDACVEGFHFLLVALRQCLDRGVERLYCLHEHVSFFHCPYLLNIVQRYEKYLGIKNVLCYK